MDEICDDDVLTSRCRCRCAGVDGFGYHRNPRKGLGDRLGVPRWETLEGKIEGEESFVYPRGLIGLAKFSLFKRPDNVPRYY